MLQRDYILRLVEQFAKALLGIVALRKSRKLAQADLAISEAAKDFVGLDVDTLLALPIDSIVTLLSPGGILDPAKAIVVAELLAEKGEVSALAEDEDEAVAYRARLRALGLLLELSAREGLSRLPDSDRLREKIRTLLDFIHAYGAAPEIEIRRVRHLEREADYASAENVVFDLIDAGNLDVLPEAVALYERLLQKSDDELTRGGLPRDEVWEGLAQLRRLSAER